MGRNLDPKCKQCRRISEKLFLKGERCSTQKCALVKRKYPPGMHGPKQRIRLSEYGLHLKEKQKAKKIYGLMERQFRGSFDAAKRKKGDVGYNFLNLLEHRLDNIIYRAGLASSRVLARQIIGHGHVLVNNKKMSIPSHIARTGDLITFKEKSRFEKDFAELKKNQKNNKSWPVWLELDNEKSGLKVVGELGSEDLPKDIDIRLIVEFYSK